MFRHLTLVIFRLRNEKLSKQLYDGKDMYIIYYIKNYMFRHLTLVIFRLRNEKHVVVLYVINYIHIFIII